mgnify:CR=1 FL=1
MGAPQCFDGHVVDEGREAAGAVEGDHTRPAAQEDGERYVVNIGNPALERGMLFDESPDVFFIIDKAAVHRVVFDNQVGVAGGMGGKRSQDMQQEAAY